MTFPYGYRPHQSDIFKTDFSEYAVGVQPPDWTKVTRPGDFNITVENANEPGSISGKVLWFNRNPQSRQTAVWDLLPTDITDVEVLIRQNKTEGGEDNMTFGGALVRGIFPNIDGSDMTGYLLTVLNDHEDRVIRYAAGTGTVLDTENGEGVGGGWFWTRARVVGNSIQMKHWKQGSAEPAYWTVPDATPVLTPGKVGIGNVNFMDVEVDYFAVSIGGPNSPPLPISLPAGF